MLLSPDNMRYKITSVTFSLTANTTHNYNIHKYSTILSSAIIHTVLTAKDKRFPTVNFTRGVL